MTRHGPAFSDDRLPTSGIAFASDLSGSQFKFFKGIFVNKFSVRFVGSAMALISGMSGRLCFGSSPSPCRDFFGPSILKAFAGRAKSLRTPLLKISSEDLIELFVKGQSKSDVGELLGRIGLTREEAAGLRLWMGQLIDSSFDARLEPADPQEVLRVKATVLSIRSARDALATSDWAELYGLMFKYILLPAEPMKYASFAAEHKESPGPREAWELNRGKLRDHLLNLQNKLRVLSRQELGRLRAEFANQRQD